MFDIQAAEKSLSNLLVDVRPVDDSVLRGEKRLGKQAYAVAYVDFADSVIERSKHLREFQERILGDDFFDAPGDLRWNKYIYIVAGPNSQADPSFAAAKASIEADKDYARKHVVLESELEQMLGGAKLFKTSTAPKTYNVLDDWGQRLSANGLGLLLDCPVPRTVVVERIGQDNAGNKTVSLGAPKQLSDSDKDIAVSHLRALKISSFRTVHDGKTYRFGNVTLIVGANGAGKTSLLEAVEHLYCGGNRRTNQTGQVRMTGLLSRQDGGNTYEVTQTKDSSRRKARLLAWYNRNERGADAIVDSFSLYNFLDTDAAYRLAGNLSSGDVATELSRLLVGPAAATTFDYFGKIRGDIDKALDKAQRCEDRLQEDMLGAERRLKELQDRPSSAHTLVDSYRAALTNIGWLHVPTESLPQASEGEALLAALGHVQALVGAGEAARTLRDIENRSVEISAAVEAVEPYAHQLRDLTEEESVLVSQIARHEANVDLLDRLSSYEAAGFSDVHRRVSVARENARQLSSRLGSLVVGSIPEISPKYSVLPYPVALSQATGEFTKLEKRVAELHDLIGLHGQAASSRATTAAKLKDAALAALHDGGADETCPICRTVHAPGRLLQLIDELTLQASESPELTRLVMSFSLAEEEADKAKQDVASLEFSESVAVSLSLDTEVTPSQALGELASLRKQSEAAQAELQLVMEEASTLGQAGFSDSEKDRIWGQVASLFDSSAQGDAESATAASEVRRIEAQVAESKRRSLARCRQSLDNVLKAIGLVCKSVATNGWNAHPVDTAAVLRTVHEEFKVVSNHAEQLRLYMQVESDAPLSELRVRVSEVASAFKQAEVASSRESASSAERRELPAKIEALLRDLKNSRNEVQSYTKAARTLDDILENASLTSATAEVLAAISDQINEVFTCIHAPHEYEYVGNDEVLLQTVDSQQSRTLDQVSTGQRAAFALSIFLARNRTATSAPPVLLIDDPIAHIDDLNALSFLDYLRDLAVNSGRQIFFATADTRIASLFSKKFSFLGDSFKTIHLHRKLGAEMPVTNA